MLPYVTLLYVHAVACVPIVLPVPPANVSAYDACSVFDVQAVTVVFPAPSDFDVNVSVAAKAYVEAKTIPPATSARTSRFFSTCRRDPINGVLPLEIQAQTGRRR